MVPCERNCCVLPQLDDDQLEQDSYQMDLSQQEEEGQQQQQAAGNAGLHRLGEQKVPFAGKYEQQLGAGEEQQQQRRRLQGEVVELDQEDQEGMEVDSDEISDPDSDMAEVCCL